MDQHAEAAGLRQRYADFWVWFVEHEQEFFIAIQQRDDIETDFFTPLAMALGAIKDGYYFLVGVADDHRVELIFTADGDVSNIIFCEELVRYAPALRNWQFTALKQPGDPKEFSLSLGTYDFRADNLWFYPNQLADYPDEVSISVVYEALTAENEEEIMRGSCLLLENYLGEMVFATVLDSIIPGKANAGEDLIAITKLKSYLAWRESEFREQRTTVQHCTDDDTYAGLEGELPDGLPLLAIMNTTLLNWQHKAAYPWLARVTLTYDGTHHNGLPDQSQYEQLAEFEDHLLDALPEADGYVNVGRETGNSEREIYLACQEFRRPALALYALQQQYAGRLTVAYDLYKDSYWQSLERFITV